MAAAPGTLYCRSCGSKMTPPYQACPNCGNVPYAGYAFCFACAAPTQANFVACPACGTQLASGPGAPPGAPAPAPAASAMGGPAMPYPPSPPGRVKAIAIMTLVGGILGIVNAVIWGFGTIFIWLPWIYSLVYGIMAVKKGSRLLGQTWRSETAPTATAIMGIINILVCDIPSVVMGIITLVFLSDPEVKAWYRREVPAPPPLQ